MGAASSKQLGRDSTDSSNLPRKSSDSDANELSTNKSLSRKSACMKTRERKSRDSADGRFEISTKAPATVHFQGQDIQIAYEPAGDGTLVVKQTDSNESESAATRIQAAFRRYKARHLYVGLKELEKMNLKITWPTGAPFIGLIIVRATNITNLEPALASTRAPLLRARCDGDHSVNIRGFRDYASESILFDYKATFVFVAVHSSAVLTMEVIQSMELAARVLGKVKIPVASMSQGARERTLPLINPNSAVVGKISFKLGYQWMRGTQDFGGYEGSNMMVLPPRKFRKANAAVERLWKVNHWLCSHDNTWSSETKFEDVVRLAVQKHKIERKETVVVSDSGRYVPAPVAVVPALKKKTGSGLTRGQTISTAEMLARTSGIEKWESAESFVHQRHQQSSISDTGSLGNEDWHLAMDELYDNPYRLEPVPDPLDECNTLSSELKEQLEAYGKQVSEFEESDSNSDTSSSISQGSRESPGMGCVEEEKLQELKEKYEKRQKRKGHPLSPFITGKFEYGIYRPAAKRDVHVFLRKAEHAVDLGTPKPVYAGVYTTTSKGQLSVPFPKLCMSSPGHYHILGLLPDDNTYGRGSMFILEKGTKCVVFDLDGTMTTSDVHVVTQYFLDSLSGSTVIGSSLGKNYDLKQRTNALSVCRLWAAKGYQVVYLSGRQGSAYNMTALWLTRHGYPPGPVHLTRSHIPTLPVYSSVGKFKVKYMEELMAKGLEIYAAYGNTATDVRAYEKIGIPKERTFIVGPNGGLRGTRRITNFTSHLPEILRLPEADKPIPYTEILFSLPNQRAEYQA